MAVAGAAAPAAAAPGVGEVFVIPIRDQVGSAVHYVVRRGLKEAIDRNAGAVVIDMKTPGGALDVTLEIMEALEKFPGRTITYVNNEAMSAGAFIAATTDEIWFAPTGIIGAAAPVSMGGQDVDTTMKQKIVSYLKARIRALSEGKPHRGEVISAMVDADYELKIGEKVIKGKGELLSLTAAEAGKTYGEPPEPLLSAGTAASVEDLIARRFGSAVKTTTLQLTWSETLAVWLNSIAPLLLGVGLLALFIEFKTPGFGAFGITGIICLAIVFLGNYIAGLSGHEPILVFALGLVLVALELFVLPGVVFLALTGVVMMLAALVWSMADLWPNEPLSAAWARDALVSPLTTLGWGLALAVGLGILFARFIPRGWIWDKMVVQSAIGGAAHRSEEDASRTAVIGRTGIAVTALRPGGQVEIDGRRYDARVEVGVVERGGSVLVTGQTDFELIVEARA